MSADLTHATHSPYLIGEHSSHFQNKYTQFSDQVSHLHFAAMTNDPRDRCCHRRQLRTPTNLITDANVDGRAEKLLTSRLYILFVVYRREAKVYSHIFITRALEQGMKNRPAFVSGRIIYLGSVRGWENRENYALRSHSEK